MHGARPACVALIGAVFTLGGGCATTSHTGAVSQPLTPDRPQIIRHGPATDYSRKTIVDFWYSDDRLNRFEIVAETGIPASAIYQASLGSQLPSEPDPAEADVERTKSDGAVVSGAAKGAAGGAAKGAAVGVAVSGNMIAGACTGGAATGPLGVLVCGSSILLAPIFIVGGTAIGAAAGGIGGSDHSGGVPVRAATYDRLERSLVVDAENGVRLLNVALQEQDPARSIARKIQAVIDTRTRKYARMSEGKQTSGDANQDEWAQARLRISVDRLDFVALEGEIIEAESPRFRLFIQVVTSFESVDDRQVPPYPEVIGYLGPAHPLHELESNDGQLFQRELDQAFQALAEYVALGHYRFQPPP